MTASRAGRPPGGGRDRRRHAAGLAVVAVALLAVGLRACRSRGSNRAGTATVTAVAPATATDAAPATSAATTTNPAPAPTTVRSSTPQPAATAATVPTTTLGTSTGVAASRDTTTVSPADPTGGSTTSTTNPVPPCTAATLGPALRAGGVDPAGLELADPRCTADFASVVVRQANRQDRFAVFELREPVWTLVNIGTSFVCQRLEIPNPDYTDIGCLGWDR